MTQDLIDALDSMEYAVLLTPEPKERAELVTIVVSIRQALQRRGCFVGTKLKPEDFDVSTNAGQ